MEQQRKKQDRKLGYFFLVICLVFIIMVARLYYLQIMSTTQFKLQSEQNRLRMVVINPRRGDIMDRNGQVLATSKPVFSISLSYVASANLEQVAHRLVEIIGEPELTVDAIIEKVRKNPRRYEPVEVMNLPWSDAAFEVITRIEERRQELPGVLIQEAPMRFYPNGTLAGHVLGTVGQISRAELDQFSEYNYDLNDRIGKTGVERSMELLFKGEQEIGLRGKKGFSQVEVNARNRPIKEYPAVPPTPGHNLVLTLDANLQRALEQSMDEVIADIKKTNPKAGYGAGVVLDVHTGAILAMASKPDINPNDFADGSFKQKMDYYRDDTLQPLLNRVIQGQYAPGSTFKMITAMAVLEAGIDPRRTVTCTGAYWKPPYIKCTKVHGVVDLYRALAVSCNVYFQWAGELAGIDLMAKIGKQFGLGSRTGLTDIGGEAAGLLPSPEWKEGIGKMLVNRNYDRRMAELEAKYGRMLAQAPPGEVEAILKKQEQEKRLLEAQYQIDLRFQTNWQPFETYNTSIGQGSNKFTILQLANYVATIANGGNRYRPYLVSQVLDAEGRVVEEFGPVLEGTVEVSPQTLAITRRAMQAVAEPGGTANFLFRHFPASVPVAAKTGTAQTGRSGDDKNKDFFGVFVAFAPADNPQIAFAGLIEYANSGGGSAGRVAKAVFEEYFGIKPQAPAVGASPAVSTAGTGSGQPSGGTTPAGPGQGTVGDATIPAAPDMELPAGTGAGTGWTPEQSNGQGN